MKSRLFFRSIIVALSAVILCLLFFSFTKAAFERRKRFPKVILIGIDGGTWNVIEPLINQGRLPNIKRLMESGTYGKFLSDYPVMISPVVWTSIATGKKPAKHGITDFLIVNWPQRAIPFTSELRITNAIWNILSEAGLKVAVVGWPVTWPVEAVNGYMIADNFLFHLTAKDREQKDIAYPKELISKLKLNGYLSIEKITIQEVLEITGLDGGAAKRLLKIYEEQKENKDIIDIGGLLNIYRLDKFNIEIGLHLLKNSDIDFLAVYFNGTDVAGHQFWKFMIGREDIFSSTAEEKRIYGERTVNSFKNVIINYYCWVDRAVGDILKFSGPYTHIVLVSDHGMRFNPPEPKVSYLHTNRLLHLLGFLEYKPGSQDIDFSKTKIFDACYFLYKDAGKFCINLKGRQPQGIVEDADYETLRDNFVRIISNIKAKGKNVFEIAELRDLNKRQPQDSQKLMSADIITHINDSLLKDAEIEIHGKRYKGSGFVKENIDSGAHDKFGILIWRGPSVKSNNEDNRYCYLDITPTLLYILNFPVAEDMDGAVMRNLFVQEFLNKNPILSIGSYDKEGSLIKTKRAESADSDFLIERLKSLGYIQ